MTIAQMMRRIDAANKTEENRSAKESRGQRLPGVTQQILDTSIDSENIVIASHIVMASIIA
jgi:hypothetical protein